MTSIPLLRLVLAAALALPVPVAAATPPPIATPAALARYLHDMPPGRSPLDAFSPGARKRFLAQLRFGREGLGGFSTDDLAHELTTSQVQAVMALFGTQAYAEGLGLTQDAYARRRRERAADAARRGCAPGRCPESPIERRYDALVLADRHGPDASRHAAIVADYARLFANDLTPAAIRHTSAPDLRLLARAAGQALDADPAGRAADDLGRLLGVMQSRGMVDDADFLSLYRARVTTRRFAAAQALARAHPGMSVPALLAWDEPRCLRTRRPCSAFRLTAGT